MGKEDEKLAAPGSGSTLAGHKTPPPAAPEGDPVERRRRARTSEDVLDEEDSLTAWEATFTFGAGPREDQDAGDSSESTLAEPPAPDSDLVLDVTDELGFAATPVAGNEALATALSTATATGAAGFDRDLRLDPDLLEISAASFGFRPAAFDLDPPSLAHAIAQAPGQAVSGDDVFRAQMHTLVGELGKAAQAGADPGVRAQLATATARAAERLGGGDALRFYQEALAAVPDHAPALRGVFRLSWQAGLAAEALTAARGLAAALPADEAAYAVLIAEAEAQLHVQAAEGAEALAPAIESDQLAGLLRACEAILRAGDGANAGEAALAPAIARLGDRLGGDAAAALHTFAAMVRELAGTPAGDAAAGSATAGALAQLRAAVRAAPASARTLLGQAVEALPSSPLTPALLRWAAALERRAGEVGAAQRLLTRARASGAGFLPALHGVDLASDDLVSAAASTASAALPGVSELTDRLASVPVETVAPVAVRLARALGATGRHTDALTLLRRALDRDPASGPALAPVLEALALRAHGQAGADSHAAHEIAALVAASDPSRRTDVALSATLARLIDARADGGVQAPELHEQALDQLAKLALGAGDSPRTDPALSWWLAWQLRAADRPAPAAELLTRVAVAWREILPGVAAALAARAGVLSAASNPQAYLAGLPVPHLHAAASDDPAALARALVAPRPEARALAARFKEAAATGGNPRLYEAVGWSIQAGAFSEAFATLNAGAAEAHTDETGARLLRRLLRMGDDLPAVAARLREQAAAAPDLRGSALFEQLAAEALERAGQRAEAAAIYRELLAGPLARDADLGLRRSLLALRDAAGLTDFWRDEFDASSGAGKNRAAAAASVEKARVILDLLEDRPAAAAEIGTALGLDPESVPARVLALCQPGVLVGAQARIAELERLARDMPSQRAVALFFAALLADGEGESATARRLFKAATGGIFGPAPIALLRRHLLAEEEAGIGGLELAELLAVAAGAIPQTSGAEPRLGLALYLRAADAAWAVGELGRAEQALQRALAAAPQDLPTLIRLGRLQEARGDHAGLMATLEAQARALRDPGRRAAALFGAAVIAADQLGDRPRAAGLLLRALELDPRHEGAFARHKQLIEASGDAGALAALLARRAQGAAPEEAIGLRLERATLLAGPLGDRASAKRELRELLILDSNNRVAIATLAGLELEDGDAAVAAELSVRQAALDDDPARLTACFLRLGRIYQGPLADIKQAVSAFEGVLDLDAGNREALLALSELYARAGEAGRGVSVTERLLEVEADPARRRTLLVRLAKLWEQSGDVRRAGIALRHASGEAPRDLSVIGELVHFHDRHKDLAARNLLLDGAAALARDDLRAGRDPMTALRTLIPLFQWRERPASAIAAAQLLIRLSPEASERADLISFVAAAARPGAGRTGTLQGLGGDERGLPRELPPGLAHVLRVLGPALARASKPDLRRYPVGRSERQGRATDLRQAFDGPAAELGVRDMEIYIAPSIPHALSVEPGDPPALVVGAGIVSMGPAAVRFAAGFLLRLCESHFSFLLREGPIEAVGLVAGLVRQFRPEHRPPYLPEAVLKASEARVGKAMNRAMRTELAPLAVQLAAGVSPEELFTAAQELAARAGLIACGDLGIALDVLAAYAGRAGAPLPALFQLPLVAQLIDFALSDEYDGLVGALGTAPRA